MGKPLFRVFLLVSCTLVGTSQSLPQLNFGVQVEGRSYNPHPPHPPHGHHHPHPPPPNAIPGGGGNCQSSRTRDGGWKFTCNPRSAPTLSSEHILWLQGPKGGKQIVDIEVPNYKIEELIKAGFKGSGDSATLINVLLRRPQQLVDAQVEDIRSSFGAPQVQLQYEPVQAKTVHYPVDKPYSPLVGQLIPPPPRPGSPFGQATYSTIDVRAGPPVVRRQ